MKHALLRSVDLTLFQGSARNGNLSTYALYSFVLFGYAIASIIASLAQFQGSQISVIDRAIVATLGLVVIYLRGVRRSKAPYGAIWWCLIVFWVLYVGRITIDTVFTRVYLGIPVVNYWLFPVFLGLIPMIALSIEMDKRTAQKAFNWVVGFGALACVGAFLIGLDRLSSGEISNGRAALEKLNPISFGDVGVSIALLAAFGIMKTGMPFAKNLYKFFPYLGLLLLGIAVALMSASRGPILQLIIVLPILVLAELKMKYLPVALALAVGISVGAYTGTTLLQKRFGITTINRIEHLKNPEEYQSTSDRIQEYRSAWNEFENHPWLGSGLEDKLFHYYPHNAFIESFMATGIFGGTAFSIAMLLISINILRVLRYGGADKWIGALFLQYLVGACLSGGLAFDSIMWGMTGAGIAVIAANRSVTSDYDRLGLQDILDSETAL